MRFGVGVVVIGVVVLSGNSVVGQGQGQGQGSESEQEQEPDPGPVADPAQGPGQAVYPVLEPRGRLRAGVERRKVHPTSEQRAEDNRQPFFLGQVRVGIEAEVNEHVDMEFSAELDDDPVIRDAYVNVAIERELQVQFGHFKRPISRIENTSAGKLPFRDRGLFNELVLEDAQWGDRSLGLMLWGRFKAAGVRWYAAVMNAAETPDVRELDQLRGADFLGRVEYEPVEWIEFGLNGGHKIMEPYAGGPNLNLSAFGGDVRVRAAGLLVVLESIAAQNPIPPQPRPASSGSPFAAVVIGYATYEIPLADWAAFEPVVAGEWIDTDLDFSEDAAVRGLAGLNFVFFDAQLRVMPQVEIVRPLGEVGARSHVKRETYYLMVSAEI